MLQPLIRTLILIIIIAIFMQQTRRMPPRSRKRRAFALAAGAIGIFALLNGLQVLGMDVSGLLVPAQTIATLLLAISAVLLVQAWRGGEMNEQIGQVRAALEKERERRDS